MIISALAVAAAIVGVGKNFWGNQTDLGKIEEGSKKVFEFAEGSLGVDAANADTVTVLGSLNVHNNCPCAACSCSSDASGEGSDSDSGGGGGGSDAGDAGDGGN